MKKKITTCLVAGPIVEYPICPKSPYFGKFPPNFFCRYTYITSKSLKKIFSKSENFSSKAHSAVGPNLFWKKT